MAVVPVPTTGSTGWPRPSARTPVVHESIEFHDIAGLVRGAHRGEGLGNKFLGNIRETDAIVHVVRAHDDAQVVHPEGRVDPVSDVDAVDTELLFADLEQAERRLERVAKQAKSLDKVAVAEERWLQGVVEALREGPAVRTVAAARRRPGRRGAAPGAHLEARALRGQRGRGRAARAAARAGGVRRGARRARDGGERPPRLRALGAGGRTRPRRCGASWAWPSPGLTTVIREAFTLLDLISFFTAGEGKEARAHAIPRGTPARRAAGSVHTDIERGFVAAEIMPWDELVEAGGYAAARERAKLRVEGRDYAMQDGDVVTFRFTP